MIAPTTTATVASLQQQDDNDNETSSAAVNATIDDPFIPIGPADEGPDEPIPNNENETATTDDGDDGSEDDNNNATDTATTRTTYYDNGDYRTLSISCKDIGYPLVALMSTPMSPTAPLITSLRHG